MKECIQPYFIRDGIILDCENFDVGLINRGRSIYEVTRMAGPGLLFLEDHLDRLFTSLDIEGIKPWFSRQEIREQLVKMIEKNNAPAGNVKIVVNMSPSGENHFLAYFVAHSYPEPDDYETGVKVISFPFERQEPNKKIWRPEFRKEVASHILRADAFEALLLNPGGAITEASKANIFCIKDGKVITTPDEHILPGITRKYVLDSCRTGGIQVDLRMIMLDELKAMDGIVLTGTSIHVMPVCCVNDFRIPVSDPIMKKVMDQFDNLVKNSTQ